METRRRRRGIPRVRLAHFQSAGDRGFLPLSFAEYKALLEWNVRNVGRARGLAQGRSPKTLTRIGISTPAWLRLAIRFGKLFQGVAGAPQRLARLNARHRFRCRQAELLASGAAPG